MSSIFNDEEVYTLVVVPPDGGWGIMVVICSFICHFVIDGNIYSFGVFLKPLNESFGTKMAQISFVGAMLNGVCYIVGPFVSACLNRYDFRLVSLTGCSIAAIAYAISSFSMNYYMFLAGNGFLLGVGFGMLYVTALVTPSLYFAKWRTIAVALATCGTGVGTLTVPNLITFSLREIGWRNTYLVMIGIVGIAALASLAFIPLTNNNVVSTRPVQYRAATSKMNFELDNRRGCTCCHWGNKYFPTTQEIAGKGAKIEKTGGQAEYRRSMYQNYSVRPRNERFLSRVSFMAERFNYCWFNCLSFMCCGCCQTPVRPMYRQDIFYGHSVHLIDKNKLRAMRMQVKLQKIKEAEAREKEKTELKKLDKATTSDKPAEKKKVHVLERAESDEDLMEYHMKVTHVTTEGELYDNFKPCCACHVAGLRTLSSMLDLRIMKSIAFLILSFNGFFFTLGYMIPFMFIAERAVEHGIAKEAAVPLISMIGGVNTVGRIISGILPILTRVNVIWFTAICGFGQGAVTAASGIYMEYWAQIVFACSYGLLAGPFYALRTILVVDLFGLANLTNIFGLQLVMSGIAGMCGPTIAGVLRDYFDNYTYSFYFSGGCIAFSAFLLTFIKPVRNWEVRTGFVEF